MKRSIDEQLDAWATAPRRKPLLLRGARQVGKTYSLKQLGKRHFRNLVVVDLERNRDWHRVFSDNLEAARVRSELELLCGEPIEVGSTLLFIDEIQACPRAIMALRYFYEELPDLHVVAAGSLLDFATGEVAFPVGRVSMLEMHPLSFVEYLWAIGREGAAQVVLQGPAAQPGATHALLLEELKRYGFVGGMPECVGAYAQSRSMREAFTVQRELAEALRQDFHKYAPRSDPRCLDEVLVAAARNVGRQIKYASLGEGFSGPTRKAAFELLCRARVLHKVPCAQPRGVPLAASVSSRRFKALLVDVGLWQHLCGMNVATEYGKARLLDVYRGAMAEQIVGQELLAATGGDLYYWAREAKSSTAEVDFLVAQDGVIHGVEVKSGAAGRLRSLHLMHRDFPDTGAGLVFSAAPFAEREEHKLRFVPIYYAGTALPGGRGQELDS